jgi:hypothetical protein
MKKAIAILVLVVVICALSHGCLENRATEVPLGQTVVLDDMALTVVKFEERDTFTLPYYYGNETPPEGATFLFVYVEGKNVGEVARYTPYITLEYKGEIDSTRYFSGFIQEVPYVHYEPYDSYKEIYPSVTEEGWIYFEVPKAFDPSEAKIRIRARGYSKTAIWTLA